MKREFASRLFETIVGTNDLGEACLVRCRDGLAEPLDSAVSKPLDVFHGVTVESFVDGDIGIIFQDFGKSP